MPEVSKYDLEIQELKGEIKLLGERISTIKDNHLHHIEEKINGLIKVMYTIVQVHEHLICRLQM